MGLGVRAKALGAVAVGLLAVAVGAWAALGALHEQAVERAGFRALRASAAAFDSAERAAAGRLEAATAAIEANVALRRAFDARDRAGLLELAKPVFAELQRRGTTHWYFHEPDRTCFLRVHRPELFGDRVDRVTLGISARSARVAAGKDLGRTAFAMRVVRPLRGPDGAPAGYVELAERVDALLARAKEQTGDEFALVVAKRHLDEKSWTSATSPARNTWNDRPDVVVVDTTTFTQGLVDYAGDVERLPEEGAFIRKEARDGGVFVRGAFPVHDAAGRNVGALFVQHDVTPMDVAFRAAQLRGLYVVLVLAAAAFAAVGVALERLAFRRLAMPRDTDARGIASHAASETRSSGSR